MSPAQAPDSAETASEPPPQPMREGDAGVAPSVTVDIRLGEGLVDRLHRDAGDPISRLDVSWLEDRTFDAARYAGIHEGTIDILITDDAEMALVHESYLDVAGTTDVITFDLSDDDDDQETEGAGRDQGVCVCAQIIVCADVAIRESQKRGGHLNHETMLYIVHGMLHCLGYDDCDPEDHDAMHAREDAILREIGIGPVYGPPDSAGAVE